MPADDLDPPIRLGTQRQALKPFVPPDRLGQALKHRLRHRPSVHILFAKDRNRQTSRVPIRCQAPPLFARLQVGFPVVSVLALVPVGSLFFPSSRLLSPCFFNQSLTTSAKLSFLKSAR